MSVATIRNWRVCLSLACALGLAPVPHALAQGSSAGIPRVGLLTWLDCDSDALVSASGPFLAGLQELGYRLGETVAIECRHGDGSYVGLATAAAELAGIPVDVIVSYSQPAAHAAQSATDSIPIVTTISGDPVAAGLARSIAKPGGNITGVSYYATELTAKRSELLKEMVPDLNVVAILSNPDSVIITYFSSEARNQPGHGRTSRTPPEASKAIDFSCKHPTYP